MSGNSPNDQIPEFLQTLGLMLPVSVEDVKQAYRDKVKTSHPDVGGSVEHFNQIQLAFERSLEYAEFRAGRLAWLGAHVEQYAQQQALIADLTSQGGIIDIEQLDWLTKSFGADFAQVIDRVVGLTLRGPKFNDDTITYLLAERRVLQSLYWLDLSGSGVTDAGLGMLPRFELISRLDLRGTAVTERGLQAIEELTELTWLGAPRER